MCLKTSASWDVSARFLYCKGRVHLFFKRGSLSPKTLKGRRVNLGSLYIYYLELFLMEIGLQLLALWSYLLCSFEHTSFFFCFWGFLFLFLMVNSFFKKRTLFFKLMNYFYFWLCWVFIAVHGLSLVSGSCGYFSLRFCSFSWCGAGL